MNIASVSDSVEEDNGSDKDTMGANEIFSDDGMFEIENSSQLRISIALIFTIHFHLCFALVEQVGVGFACVGVYRDEQNSGENIANAIGNVVHCDSADESVDNNGLYLGHELFRICTMQMSQYRFVFNSSEHCCCTNRECGASQRRCPD